MGEIIPYAVLALLILFVLVLSLAKIASRKVVVKPIEEEDMVCRVKIKITSEDAKELASKLSDAAVNSSNNSSSVMIEQYDKKSDRLLRFEIVPK